MIFPWWLKSRGAFRYALGLACRRTAYTVLQTVGQGLKRLPVSVPGLGEGAYPKSNLLRRINRIMFAPCGANATGHGFTQIDLEGFHLFFSNGPLLDRRGIGRVCREQLKQLSVLSIEPVRQVERIMDAYPRLVFYTSIHWCPSTLPADAVIMIHDVIPLLFPRNFPRAVVNEWRYRFRHIAAQAKHIITISKASAQAIEELLEVPLDKISVVYNGITELPQVDETPLQLPERPYFVFLGADDPHKNLDVVLQALACPDLAGIDLAMIGDNQTQEKLRKIDSLGLEGRVHFMGRLGDTQVSRALLRSQGLVFPSLYEGFGLPPLEAALLGVPVICSNRPAMNEMLDSVVRFVEPSDVDGWAQAMKAYVHDPGEGAALAQLAKSKAQAFTWQASIDHLISELRPLAH